MSMLGATTEELVTLANQLATTTSDIAGVSTETQGIADSVTQEMESAFGRAIGAITSSMGVMSGSVATARGQLDGTSWTGNNRAVFDGAYADFNAAMSNLEAAIGDAYQQFDAQLKHINGLIQEFQLHVTSSLGDAQASTTSMQHAVDAQRDNLEMVMNTGLAMG